MRTAVISDIHGNLEALEQVLADIERARVDTIFSLGDNVGYGPDPERVIEILEGKGVPSIMGNHELGVVDKSYEWWFNLLARRSLHITRRLLSDGSMDLIRKLRHAVSMNGSLFVHGCPPDSVTEYLFEVPDDLLVSILIGIGEDICFVGHTHVSALVSCDGTNIRRQSLFEAESLLPGGMKYIVNVGSVGQPRDGDNRARYVIWDDRRRSLHVRYVAYDIAQTAEKILRLGFPRINADRLW